MPKAIEALTRVCVLVNCKSVKDLLSECVSYNPSTGEFIRKRRPLRHFMDSHARNTYNAQQAGKPAGSRYYRPGRVPKCVMLAFSFRGVTHYRIGAHMAAAILMDWVIPDGHDIDHADRNPFDNRSSNLRIATKSQNQMNQGNSCKNGVPRKLPKGVCLESDGSCYRVSVYKNRKGHYRGRFATVEEAAKAYREIGMKLHGEFFCAG